MTNDGKRTRGNEAAQRSEGILKGKRKKKKKRREEKFKRTKRPENERSSQFLSKGKYIYPWEVTVIN
jgi:hypothetical protein